MTDFRRVTATFAVSPQIRPEDVAAVAAQGFTMVINNRPDGEAPNQPTSDEIEAVAREAGLDYAHIPVVGRPGPEQVQAVHEAVARAKGPVLAYCRSGTRSINTWSLGEALLEGRDRGELLRLGAAVGYDLSGSLGPA